MFPMPGDPEGAGVSILPREQVHAALQAIGARADAEIDIGEAALLLAALDRPEVPLDRYRAHLAEMGAAVTSAVASLEDAEAVATAIRASVHESYGYSGDERTYDDLQNANLIRVIDRRKGLPVALGILYMDIGRRAGLAVDGLAFPGHFLLRLEVAGRRLVLDPFNGGRTLSAAEMRALLAGMMGKDAALLPEHHQIVSPRTVLLRLQNNIKIRALKVGNTAHAAETLRSMAALNPQDTALWFELGELEAKTGSLNAGIAAFEKALATATDARLRARLTAALQGLRHRLN